MIRAAGAAAFLRRAHRTHFSRRGRATFAQALPVLWVRCGRRTTIRRRLIVTGCRAGRMCLGHGDDLLPRARSTSPNSPTRDIPNTWRALPNATPGAAPAPWSCPAARKRGPGHAHVPRQRWHLCSAPNSSGRGSHGRRRRHRATVSPMPGEDGLIGVRRRRLISLIVVAFGGLRPSGLADPRPHPVSRPGPGALPRPLRHVSRPGLHPPKRIAFSALRSPWGCHGRARCARTGAPGSFDAALEGGAFQGDQGLVVIHGDDGIVAAPGLGVETGCRRGWGPNTRPEAANAATIV